MSKKRCRIPTLNLIERVRPPPLDGADVKDFSSILHTGATFKLNVVTSQFIRFGRRISTMTAFLRASSNLVARMIYSGYEGDRVYKKVDDFQRYWFKYCAHLGRWRDFKAAFGSCVRRRIDELVGNLLNDVHAAT